MGGQRWIQQFLRGFTVEGHLTEPGAYPVMLDTPEPSVDCAALAHGGQLSLKCRNKVPGIHDEALWVEANKRSEDGRIGGPHGFAASGRLTHRGMEAEKNPARRL